MPLTPVTPSAVTGAPGGVSTVGARATEGREDIVVNMQDACDSDTFNEALQNPEACVRAGGVTFDQFIAELTAADREQISRALQGSSTART